jgi:hypothetical protein
MRWDSNCHTELSVIARTFGNAVGRSQKKKGRNEFEEAQQLRGRHHA